MQLPMHTDHAPEVGNCLLRESVPSRTDCKQEVIERYAGQLLDRGWVLPADVTWLKLCLEETIVNAMIHGNEGDPDLMVECSLWEDAGDWVLIVSDYGDGFTQEDVPDPEDPEALLFEHGRGILLMQDWLDALSYYRNGATAVLRRHKENAKDDKA